jgi:hypothetical protein
MWVSVLTKTNGIFIWGFFFQYKGIMEMPIYIYVWGFIVFTSMALIGFFEWKR